MQKHSLLLSLLICSMQWAQAEAPNVEYEYRPTITQKLFTEINMARLNVEANRLYLLEYVSTTCDAEEDCLYPTGIQAKAIDLGTSTVSELTSEPLRAQSGVDISSDGKSFLIQRTILSEVPDDFGFPSRNVQEMFVVSTNGYDSSETALVRTPFLTGSLITAQASDNDLLLLWHNGASRVIDKVSKNQVFQGPERHHVATTISRDGKYVAAFNGTNSQEAYLFSVETGQMIATAPSELCVGMKHLSFSGNGRYLNIICHKKGKSSLNIYEVSDQGLSEIASQYSDGNPPFKRFSTVAPDGKTFAVLSDDSTSLDTRQNRIEIFNVQDGQRVRTIDTDWAVNDPESRNQYNVIEFVDQCRLMITQSDVLRIINICK